MDEKAQLRASYAQSDQYSLAPPPSYTAAASSSTSGPNLGLSSASTFASLSMHMTDRLRLLSFPTDISVVIRQTITTHWPRGVQEERDYYGSHEFKMRGNPWSGNHHEAVFARRLMCRIFEALAKEGWCLYFSTDISKKQLDKDTLIFRHQDPSTVPQREWFSIAFSNSDQIRFIDAPQSLALSVVTLLTKQGLVQRHRPHEVPGAYEIKLHGYPWVASGGETMRTRMLLLELVQALDAEGWSVYASVDQKNGPGGDSHRTETDTWFVCRTVGAAKAHSTLVNGKPEF